MPKLTTNAENILKGDEAGTFVTTNPVIGYKKIECSSQWSLFGLVNFGRIKDRKFVAQVTIPKDETIIRSLERYSAPYNDYDSKEPSDKLRTTSFDLDKIFHNPLLSINKCHSIYEPNYEYTPGASHKPDKFDTEEHYTCTNGLHFFTQKSKAEDYSK